MQIKNWWGPRSPGAFRVSRWVVGKEPAKDFYLTWRNTGKEAWEDHKLRCPRSQAMKLCFKRKEWWVISIASEKSRWELRIKFGHPGIFGDTNKCSFIGMMGTKPSLESVKKERRKPGETIKIDYLSRKFAIERVKK